MSSLALRSQFSRLVLLVGTSATIAFAAGCGGDDDASTGGNSGGGSSQSDKITATDGKEIFQTAGCVSCHTLAAAGGAGNIGPNLDEEKPDKAEIVRYVTEGDGRMPSFKDRLTAEQIDTLADYIVSVEGK